jgi:hypothetical protein
MMRNRAFHAAVAALFLAMGSFAADDEDARATQGRRFSFGLRVQAFPYPLFKTSTSTSSTTKPIADYNYTGSTDSPKVAVGPAVEFRFTRHLSIGTDLVIHRADYKEVTEIRSGKKDPNSSTDDRLVTTITQTTTASYWDLPVLARYYGLWSGGFKSHLYAVGGLTYRRVGRVRTGNEFSNADGTTDYHEKAAVPSRTKLYGPTVGVGLRVIDDFHIKITPEARFTHWSGNAFQGQTYRSVPNELKVGIGVTF